MSAAKNFVNKCIPEYVPEDLPWYERDRLITYIDQMKYKDFISDPDAHVKNTQIINFQMIHANVEVHPARIPISFVKLLRRKT